MKSTLAFLLFLFGTLLYSQTIDLAGAWSFALDPMKIGQESQWHLPPKNWEKVATSASEGWDQVNGWDQVQAPHCWTADPRYREYTGHAWYRRAFPVEASTDSSSIYLLHVDSLGDRGCIWINGQPVGNTLVSGIANTFDITKAIKPGENNLITIRADNTWDFNSIPGARKRSTLPREQLYPWPNYGGILGNITIEKVPTLYIQNQKIETSTEADSSFAEITIRCQLSGSADKSRNSLLSVIITDATSKEIVARGTVKNPAENDIITLKIPNPQLWSPESPRLYQSTLTLNSAGQSHVRSDYFGIRNIKVSGTQILLNGKPIYHAGANRARGHPVFGGIDNDEVAEKDVRLLKEAGLIFARLQHTPPSAALLKYADQYGLIIIAEIPAWGFAAEDMSNPLRVEIARKSMEQMIRNTWNHPSIIGWSVGNEYESWTPEGVAWTKDLVALSRNLDKTRPVTFAALGSAISPALKGNKEDHAYDHVDFICQNLYYKPESCARYLDLLHKRWPDHPVLLCEFGLRVDRVKSEDERIAHYNQMLQIVRDRPWICGLSYWSFNDYRSIYPLSGVEGTRPWGIVDEHRNPRPLYYHIKQTLKENPLGK